MSGHRLAYGALARHVARSMAWAPLLVGCCLGIGVSLLTASTARLQEPALLITVIRASFVPMLAGLAFVLADPHRQVSAADPVPSWVTPGVRVLFALPVVGVTWSLELGLGNHALAMTRVATARHATLPALAMTTELAACCAATLSVAAAVERSRWHDLGGAAAAPLALLLLACLAASPMRLIPTTFVAMTGTQRHDWLRAWLLWAVLGGAGAVAAIWSSRDAWRRIRLVRPVIM